MNVEVREYNPQDYDPVLNLARQLPEWFNEDALRRSIPLDLKFQKVFVAEDSETIRGFISLFVMEGRLHIGWLAVAKESHGRGVGRKLIEKAEAFAREHGIAELATYTLGDSVDYPPYEETRKFYYRMGFEVYERCQTDNQGCPEEMKIKKNVL